MRLVVAGVVFGLASVSASAQTGLTPFEFKGFVAGAEVPATLLKGCRLAGADAECVVYPTVLSNVRVGYQVKVHNSKLSSVYVEAFPISYPEIMAAFTAKYGAPCGTEDAVWSNAMGAKIDNPTTTWCFSTGKLTVAKYGQTIRHMLIFYQDDNKAPPPPPKLDF